MGTLEQFCGDTVDISENSENNLKAIVVGRQVARMNGIGRRAGKWLEKSRGEEKAVKNGPREIRGCESYPDFQEQ